jgi:hypothetical protein
MADGQEIRTQTADGVTHVFPAGTPPDVVDGAIKTYVSSQPGAIQQKEGGPIYNTKTNPPPKLNSQLRQDQETFAHGETLPQLPNENPEDYIGRGIRASNSVSGGQRQANMSSELQRNVQDLPRNLGHTMTAASLPLLPATLATAPAATILGIGGSLVGGKLGQKAVELGGGGQTAQDWGGLGGSVLGGIGGGMLGAKVAPAARTAIGSKVFTPEGELSPTGEAIAHPIEKGTEFGLRKLFPPPVPEGTGAPLPSADEFYEKYGSDLMRRGTQQVALDRQGKIGRGKYMSLDDVAQGSTSSGMPSMASSGTGLPTAAQPVLVKNFTPPNTEEGIPGSIMNPKGRQILLPSEVETDAQGNIRPKGYRAAQQRAHENGMTYASGARPAYGGKVPRGATPTMNFENPSVPRSVTKFPWEEEENQ